MINVKKCVHLIKQHPWNQPIQLFCSCSVLTHTFDSLFLLFFLFLPPSLYYPSPSFSLVLHSFLTPTISFIKPWDLFLLPSSSPSSSECIQWSFSLFFPFPFYFFYSHFPPLVLSLSSPLSLSLTLYHVPSTLTLTSLFCFVSFTTFHFISLPVQIMVQMFFFHQVTEWYTDSFSFFVFCLLLSLIFFFLSHSSLLGIPITPLTQFYQLHSR